MGGHFTGGPTSQVGSVGRGRFLLLLLVLFLCGDKIDSFQTHEKSSKTFALFVCLFYVLFYFILFYFFIFFFEKYCRIIFKIRLWQKKKTTMF